MRRRYAIIGLVAGSSIVLALLAVFAIELANTQANSRGDVETQAHQRGTLAAGLIDSVFQAVSVPNAQVLQSDGAPTVSDANMNRNRGANAYIALLDSSGRVLAHSSGFTAQARSDLTSSRAVGLIQNGHPWALGNVRPYGEHGVVDFASALRTRSGARILVTGFSPSSLSGFITAELVKIPGVRGAHHFLLDGNGVVLASTNPARPPGYVFHTPAQLDVLSHRSGEVSGHYFDQVTLANTTWRLVFSAPEGPFFATVSGLRHWVPWLIFLAFAIVAAAAILLGRRVLRSNDQVREANAQLAVVNAQLASANSLLAEANAALEESNARLVDVNGELAVTNAVLEDRARELTRSNFDLQQFASIASHDLQEPLRKVRTFTDRLKDTDADQLSEQGAEYLSRVNAAAARMQALIEDLLRYARVSSEGREFTQVDLGAVTAQVLEDLEVQISRSGAVIHVGELPTINADASQMRQLMQNLISNALKFQRENAPPKVEIESKLDHGWLTIEVRDNGIGFEPEYSRRIFRVFERLHGRNTYPGTGIGLALCRRIAERHGGTVTAYGVPGEGSTFTITVQTQRTEAVLAAPGAQTRDSTSEREQSYAPA
jgi:signal transduction histidine kinase